MLCLFVIAAINKLEVKSNAQMFAFSLPLSILGIHI